MSENKKRLCEKKAQVPMGRGLFLPTAWVAGSPHQLKAEDVTNHQAPADWRPRIEVDLTRAIDDLMTGKDQAEWLQGRLTQLYLTEQAIAQVIQLFQQSPKSGPTWQRARQLYNSFLARYQGLYGVERQNGSKR